MLAQLDLVTISPDAVVTMNPVIPISALLLVLLCPGCENKRAKEAEVHVLKMEKKLESLEAEVQDREIQLQQLQTETSEAVRAREELEKKDQEFFEKVRSRLAAIRSDHAKTVELDEPSETLIAKLKEIEEELQVKVTTKEKENEVTAMMLAVHIVPANEWMDRFASEIPWIKESIEALEKEIESLKKQK